MVGIGGLAGLTRIFLASAWLRRDVNLGMISGRQNPDINARFLENDRPRERKKRSVDPLTSGGMVECVDKSLEADNVAP